MKLVGFVSDERYVAVCGADVEFVREGRTELVTRSAPRGAVHASLPDGDYRVVLTKPGFGSKIVDLTLPLASPYAFRLLADGLLGYAWPKWVRSGERSEFRVHAVEPYRLSLLRYGLKREMVRLIGWFDEHGPRANQQVTPDGDYTQSGCCWNRVGYGSPHHTQFAAAPERSGLYYFLAETESGGFASFPWIVSPAAASAPIAVVLATNTWNAYNSFGGRSNYINAAGLPDEPTVNARQELRRYTQPGSFSEWMFEDDAYPALSFERPEPGNQVRRDEEAADPIRGRSECHLAPAEWRMLAWLEREGFEYDLYSEAQLHNGEIDLGAYRVLMLGAHPEYWSREMYSRVKAWVWDRGGRLVYPGGNGLNCEVLLECAGPSALKNVGVDGATVNDVGVDGATPSRVDGSSVDGATVNDVGVDGATPSQVNGPSVDGATPSQVNGPSVDGATPSRVDGPSVDGATPSRVDGPSVDGAVPSRVDGSSVDGATVNDVGVDGATPSIVAMRCLSYLPSGAGAMFVPDPGDPSRTLESRFHRTFESEANLLGVVCSDAGIMTAAPYRVIESGHWAFRGTGLREGDLFGEASLHERVQGGASGHETDKMSASSPPGTVLLARGENPDEGGAHMVTYETPSGGAVFSAGSVTYAASLLVDDIVSKITRNVLERFLK